MKFHNQKHLNVSRKPSINEMLFKMTDSKKYSGSSNFPTGQELDNLIKELVKNINQKIHDQLK